MVRRMFVDTGSSVDIITLKCLKKLQYGEKDLQIAKTPIEGLGWQITYPLGTKKLPVQVGDKDKSRNIETNFSVIDILMAYNAILGCLTLNAIKALVLIQFKLDGERVEKPYEDQKIARECHYV